MSSDRTRGERFIGEMKEFGSFHKKTQRYIRQSLDVAFKRGDPVALWGRTIGERDNIRLQMHNYRLMLDRTRIRLDRAGKVDIAHIEYVNGPMTALAAFDLSMGCLPGFGSFRFLYERLFGGDVRPWLPSIYVAAAALPIINPSRRRELLQAISEKSCTCEWSLHDPEFVPEWVEKVDITVPPTPPPVKKLPPPETPSSEPPTENA